MKYISLLLFILLLCGCKQQELLNHLDQQQANDVLAVWICPYISRHLLSLNPLQARCRRYSRG
ncbi:hypothetical protein OFB78_25665, partial [Escherichia coli]|nr:hypothetical protein [Escherichia coli]MCV5110758.1 hypothetical protein [Escherichia coli]